MSHKSTVSTIQRGSDSAMYLIPSAEGRRDDSGNPPTVAGYQEQRTQLMAAVRDRLALSCETGDTTAQGSGT